MAHVVSSGILMSFMVYYVTSFGTSSLFRDQQQLFTGSRTPQKDSNLKESEISDYLQNYRGSDSDSHGASAQFMLHLFKDLVHGKELDEAVGHTDGQTRNFIQQTDTIRSFSPSKYNSIFFVDVAVVAVVAAAFHTSCSKKKMLLWHYTDKLYHTPAGGGGGGGYSHIMAVLVCGIRKPPFFRPDTLQKTPLFESDKLQKTHISTEMTLSFTFRSALIDLFCLNLVSLSLVQKVVRSESVHYLASASSESIHCFRFDQL